jgi:hypothetical protein
MKEISKNGDVMIEHDLEYVLNHMKTEGKRKVTFVTGTATVVWKFVPVSQCRDYDGTFAGWADRPGEVLQKMNWVVGKSPVYTNFWNVVLEKVEK